MHKASGPLVHQSNYSLGKKATPSLPLHRMWDLKALKHIATGFFAIMKKLHYLGPLQREE